MFVNGSSWALSSSFQALSVDELPCLCFALAAEISKVLHILLPGSDDTGSDVSSDHCDGATQAIANALDIDKISVDRLPFCELVQGILLMG